ncbi:MAG: preprotein translocase subunit SecD [Actinomycetota bacterium]|nr:preprotein translocase subunit SecD [Actinomycetota bacterium]
MPPAKRTSPGRPLVVVVLLLAVLYGWMALGGRYSPALGLDLRGGTTVTLTPVALDGAKIRSSDIATTKTILEKRVNGLGVGNAEVKTEGSNIVVSVPGKDTQGALKDIGKTALLSIRQVYETNQPVSGGTDVPDTSSPSVTTSISPGATPSSSSTVTPSTSPSGSVSPSGSATSPKALGQDRNGAQAQPAAFHRADSSSPSAAASTPAASASPSPSASATSAAADVNPATPETTPTAEELAAYAKLDCSVPANQQGGARKDLSNKFLVTCGNPDASPVYYKYLLHPTLIAGRDVSTASAALDSQTGTQWNVLLTFKSTAANTWAKFTAAHVGTLTSIVLDGNVYSAETIQGAITGPTQITGSFTHKTASDLANVLKYGALPLTLKTQTARTVSATLGSSELKAGLLAGAIGLVLVLLYSFFYYRGLSIVTVTSLALSAAIQYPIIVLLGKAINYTLTLAGIAGLIVAIGVTADSFVVFFERLRDEVREGNTLRTSVEKGWVRARRTIISADVVSLIASVVLYLTAIGDVRGFAFTLGLSTVIDLVVVFLFTKPLITLLARTKFFGEGHRLSGLDAARLGVERLRSGTSTITRRVAPTRKV